MAELAEDQSGDRARRLGVQAGQHVAVGVHRDGDVGVPQSLADHLGGNTGGQRRGRVAVTNVVQPDPGQAGGAGVLLEPPGEPLRVQRPAVRPGENQAAVLPPRPDRQPLLKLAPPVLTQGRNGGRVEGERAGQEDATGAAVSLLLELCAAANDEDGEEEGFAAALASIDVARLGATTNSYMQLLDAVMTLALVPGTDS